MTDYSKPYRGVTYFGVWAAETADDYGRRDAAAVLAGAVECCADTDMRDDAEVMAALAYLAAHGHAKAAQRFRRALDLQRPDERRHAAAAAVQALKRYLNV